MYIKKNLFSKQNIGVSIIFMEFQLLYWYLFLILSNSFTTTHLFCLFFHHHILKDKKMHQS